VLAAPHPGSRRRSRNSAQSDAPFPKPLPTPSPRHGRATPPNQDLVEQDDACLEKTRGAAPLQPSCKGLRAARHPSAAARPVNGFANSASLPRSSPTRDLARPKTPHAHAASAHSGGRPAVRARPRSRRATQLRPIQRSLPKPPATPSPATVAKLRPIKISLKRQRYLRGNERGCPAAARVQRAARR